MVATTYEPKPRYVVEVANTISYSVSGARHAGAWEFRYAFEQEMDAYAAADRLAEEHEFVRVIDRRTENNEENI
jgi:hypothetical protein